MPTEHAERSLKDGGHVIVLDTGAEIPPEAEAMLQALHSRSTGGLRRHLEMLAKKGPSGFLKTFYVGYGHKSIGDCGSATVFIESVSMFVAKAVQDWRLYSGQESSTRYVDFSQQAFIDPIGTEQSQEILEGWRTLYLAAQEPVSAFLHEQFPRQENEDETVYEKAIMARRFDITRSLLPAGASTNLAWHGNLRQFADALLLLRHHPLAEVREVADSIESALQETFPGSFDTTLRYSETETYNTEWMRQGYYYSQKVPPEFAMTWEGLDRELLESYREFLQTRPEKTELPPQIAECGMLRYEFLIDFGSFRDVQRHRAVVQRMPLLTVRHGFHPWYLSEFPEQMRRRVEEELMNRVQIIEKLDISEEEKQYFIPMGYQVPCRMTGDLKALVYLAELRSTRFVHPTLRTIAIRIAEDLQKRFSEYGLVIHTDPEPHQFDIRRGLHDIVKR